MNYNFKYWGYQSDLACTFFFLHVVLNYIKKKVDNSCTFNAIHLVVIEFEALKANPKNKFKNYEISNELYLFGILKIKSVSFTLSLTSAPLLTFVIVSMRMRFV